jgi:hypothetical protein
MTSLHSEEGFAPTTADDAFDFSALVSSFKEIGGSQYHVRSPRRRK